MYIFKNCLCCLAGEHSLEQLPAPTRGGHGSSSTSPYRQPYPHSPPSHVQRHQGKGVAEDYNPWGKPGCGAPMRTSSGNVITDYRRKAVITGPNHEQGVWVLWVYCVCGLCAVRACINVCVCMWMCCVCSKQLDVSILVLHCICMHTYTCRVFHNQGKLFIN